MRAMAEQSRLTDAAFIGGDHDGHHGFVLRLKYRENDRIVDGILTKQDGATRVFVTPQTCTKNAYKLGIHEYRFETWEWDPRHYDAYDAQVRSHRRKRK